MTSRPRHRTAIEHLGHCCCETVGDGGPERSGPVHLIEGNANRWDRAARTAGFTVRYGFLRGPSPELMESGSTVHDSSVHGTV